MHRIKHTVLSWPAYARRRCFFWAPMGIIGGLLLIPFWPVMNSVTVLGLLAGLTGAIGGVIDEPDA